MERGEGKGGKRRKEERKKDIGKTTLAHAIVNLLPKTLIGTLSFAKWTKTTNNYLLHHCKEGKYLAVTDDLVNSVDGVELEQHPDILDGIIDVSANSKYGSMEMIKVCPQIFTSNEDITKRPRLANRIESFQFPNETCLKDFCDLKFVQCGIVSLMLNYITYVSREEPNLDKYPDIEFQNLKAQFRKGTSPNLDKLKIIVQEECFTVQRSELASIDDKISLPNSEDAYSQFI